MKAKYILGIVLAGCILSVSCTRRVIVVERRSAHRIPPGQAKKITGSQSARPYAPGQQKHGPR